MVNFNNTISPQHIQQKRPINQSHQPQSHQNASETDTKSIGLPSLAMSNAFKAQAMAFLGTKLVIDDPGHKPFEVALTDQEFEAVKNIEIEDQKVIDTKVETAKEKAFIQEGVGAINEHLNGFHNIHFLNYDCSFKETKDGYVAQTRKDNVTYELTKSQPEGAEEPSYTLTMKEPGQKEYSTDLSAWNKADAIIEGFEKNIKLLSDARKMLLSPDAEMSNNDIRIKNDNNYELETTIGDYNYTIIKETEEEAKTPKIQVKVATEGLENWLSLGFSPTRDAEIIKTLETRINNEFKKETIENCQKADSDFAVFQTTRKDTPDGGYTIKSKSGNKTIMLNKRMSDDTPQYSLTVMESESKPVSIPLEPGKDLDGIVKFFETDLPALQKTAKSAVKALGVGTAEQLQKPSHLIYDKWDVAKFTLGDKECTFYKDKSEDKLFLNVKGNDIPEKEIEISELQDDYNKAMLNNFSTIIEKANDLGPGLDCVDTFKNLTAATKAGQAKWVKLNEEEIGGVTSQEFLSVYKGTKYTIQHLHEAFSFFGSSPNRAYLTIEKPGQEPTRVFVGSEEEKAAYDKLAENFEDVKNGTMEDLLKDLATGLMGPIVESIINPEED